MSKLVAATAIALLAGPVLASEPPGIPRGFDALVPLGAEELAAASGRAGMGNQALLQGNQVGAGSVTGSNSISGSLNGNAGVTTVFQNTGNNTVFQAATSITINLR